MDGHDENQLFLYLFVIVPTVLLRTIPEQSRRDRVRDLSPSSESRWINLRSRYFGDVSAQEARQSRQVVSRHRQRACNMKFLSNPHTFLQHQKHNETFLRRRNKLSSAQKTIFLGPSLNEQDAIRKRIDVATTRRALAKPTIYATYFSSKQLSLGISLPAPRPVPRPSPGAPRRRTPLPAEFFFSMNENRPSLSW